MSVTESTGIEVLRGSPVSGVSKIRDSLIST